MRKVALTHAPNAVIDKVQELEEQGATFKEVTIPFEEQPELFYVWFDNQEGSTRVAEVSVPFNIYNDKHGRPALMNQVGMDSLPVFSEMTLVHQFTSPDPHAYFAGWSAGYVSSSPKLENVPTATELDTATAWAQAALQRVARLEFVSDYISDKYVGEQEWSEKLKAENAQLRAALAELQDSGDV